MQDFLATLQTDIISSPTNWRPFNVSFPSKIPPTQDVGQYARKTLRGIDPKSKVNGVAGIKVDSVNQEIKLKRTYNLMSLDVSFVVSFLVVFAFYIM